MLRQKLPRVRVKALLLAPVLGLALFVAVIVPALSPVAHAANTSSTLNFQARLTTNTGAIVPDGLYNLRFKIYDGGTQGGSAGTGQANSGTGGTYLWTESYYDTNGVTAGNDNRVTVINGYFSVNLGSQTAFSGINWDQELWMTMDIGGTTQTATPTYDGEMTNSNARIKLTAVPYAFAAGKLATGSGSSRGTLSFASLGQATDITLPDPGASTATVCYQSSSSCGFLTGSPGSYIQNSTSTQTNANFNIQSAAAGSVGAIISGASGQSVDLFELKNSSTVFSVGNNGQTLFKPTASNDSTTFFQVQSSGSTTPVLDIDTANTRVGIGMNNPSFALDVSGSIRSSSTLRTNSGLVNDSTFNNSRFQTLSTGAVIDRNVADANAALIVQQISATSTGDILQLKNSGNTVATVSQSGAVKLQNSANSATAFQVQDASGSALFNINSTDGYTIDNGTTAAGNVIENPGFESGGTTAATGWFTPSASQVITNSSANANSGNNELQITGNSSTHAVTTKYIAVHPGDTVYAEAYVKNSAAAPGDAGIYLEFSDKDKGNATFSNNDTGVPGTSYVIKSISTTVPASKYFVRIAASVKSTATSGTFYFDDFYLKKVNEQAALLITNATSTAFQVQNASSQTVLGVDSSANKIFTTIPDSGTAIGFLFNTPSYTTSGAKLLSLQNNGTPKFSVDKDGNVAITGGLALSGAISGATTVTGSGNFNTTGGSLQTNSVTRIDNSGNLTGIGNFTATAGSTFATTGANGFTFKAGTDNATTFQVQNASSSKAVLTVDTTGNKTILGTGGASGITGTAQFNYSGSTGSITIAPLDPTSTAYTLSLPAENGTFCTSAASSTANCTNFASASSLTSGLATKLNKNAVDTSGVGVTAVQGNLYAFTNNSSGVASGVLKLDNNNNTDNALYVTGTTDYASGKAYILVNNTNGTPSGNLIDLQANAADKFTVDASGNIVAAGNISIATGKLYEINGIQITSAALSNDSNLAKLTTGPQTFSNDNTFSSASNSFTGNGANLSSLDASNVSSGTLADGRLSANVAFRNQDNTFASTNTFSPTANNVGTTINQTSGTATSGSVLDVQAVGGAHFLQITNAASGEGNVTLQSVGATRDLILNSASGILKLGSATTSLQKSASSFTIDIANAGTSTLTIGNSNGANVADLSVTGNVGVASGKLFKVGAVNGSTISTCGASNYVSSFASTGGLVTGGSCTALGTVTLQTAYDNSSSPATITTSSSSKGIVFKAGSGNDSTTLFQVQDSGSKAYILVNSSGASVSVGDTGATSTVQIGNSGAFSSTVNIGSATGGATTINSLTTNINSSTIATGQSALTLFNTNATNVTAFGAATTISLGAATGTVTLNNANTNIGSVTGSGVLTNNGATFNRTLAVANDSDGGALGGTPSSPLSAAQSVDIYTSISITQTTGGQTITLPTPTASTNYGRLLYISNIGTASFIISGVSINPGQAGTLVWSNTNTTASWQFAGAGADSIANQNANDQTANFRISGVGRATGGFTAPSIDSITGALSVGTGTATSVSIGGVTNTTAITLQGAAGVAVSIGSSAGSGVFTNNGATLNTTLALGDLAAGAIGANTATVDIYTSFSIAPTAAGRAYTIPTPTANTSYGRAIYVSNIASGTNYFTISGIRIPPGSTGTLIWSNTSGASSWQFAGAGGASIENQNSADQSANFRIAGTGSLNVSSTTAFQVQNGSSAAVLTVDTSGLVIQIGSSTSNSGTAILALNNNDGSTTPTEVDGGMYYNNSTGQFLCGENGFWVSCGVPPRDHSYDMYDEFMSGNSGSLAQGAYGIGGLNWFNSLISAPIGLTYTNNPAAGGNTPAADVNRPGVLNIEQTGTGNNTGQTTSLGIASVKLGTSRVDLKTAVNITAPQSTVLIGLHNETTATTAPTTGVYFKEAGAGSWNYCYVNATPTETCTSTCSGTGGAITATAGSWFRLEIIVASSTEVDYYVNGSKCAVTGITYNSTNKVAPAYSSYKTSGSPTAQDLYLDYFELLGTTSTAR